MSDKVSSNRDIVTGYTNDLTEKRGYFFNTYGAENMSIGTDLTANTDMKKVFKDSLSYTDDYCPKLAIDIENVLRIAGLFEEVDKANEQNITRMY